MFKFTPGLRSILSRDWTVVTVVTMVPSGMTVRSTSTFLVGVIEERIDKALWVLRGSSASIYSNWRRQQGKKKKQNNNKWKFQSAKSELKTIIFGLTSAVMVAFGAKPCPGLIDSLCCAAGSFHLGCRAMEAWPGRNSINIQNKNETLQVFIESGLQ